MMESQRRREALREILSLVPPRSGEEAAARENLERLDLGSLEAMRDRLTKAAQMVGQPTWIAAKPNEQKRAAAHAMLVSGLSKLAEATRRLEAHDEKGNPGSTGGSSVVALVPSAAAPQKGAVASADPVEREGTEHEGSGQVRHTDSWIQPLLFNDFLTEERNREPYSGADARRRMKPRPDASVVPVDESVLAIDKIQSLVSHQIVEIFHHTNILGKYKLEIDDLCQSMMKDRVLEKYLRVHLTSIFRDIFSLALDRRLNTAKSERLTRFYDHLQSHLRAPSAAVEPTFLSHLSPALGETDAIEGLAKMVVRMGEYDPQCVVVMDGGGEIAGKLVERTARTDARFIVWNRESQEIAVPHGFASGVRRVLVVDDITRTGRAMQLGFARCRATFKDASVLGMTLIGTVESANILRDKVFSPTISPDSGIDVPWNKKGKYHSTSNEHILGATQDQNHAWNNVHSLAIEKNLLERAIDRLSA